MAKLVEPVRLVAFDLDGTIFPVPLKHVITARLERALAAAHEQGVVLVAATGRPVWMVGETLEAAPWLDWTLSTNGARVVPMKGAPAGAEGFEFPIPRALALAMLDLLDPTGATLNAHLHCKSVLKNWDARPLPEFALKLADEDPELARAMAARNPIMDSFGPGMVEETESMADVMRTDPSLRLDKLDVNFQTPEERMYFEEELTRLGGLEVACVGARDLEITAAGVTKGVALDRLCAALGIDERSAVAFGDSGNDLPMAGRAATFVAMGNATDEVKAAADEVCPSVLDDGVAVWLEEHVL